METELDRLMTSLSQREASLEAAPPQPAQPLVSRPAYTEPAPATPPPVPPFQPAAPARPAATELMQGAEAPAGVPQRVYGSGTLKLVIVPRPDGDTIWEVWNAVERLVRLGHVLMSYSPAEDGSALDMMLNISGSLTTQQFLEAFPGSFIKEALEDTLVMSLAPQ